MTQLLLDDPTATPVPDLAWYDVILVNSSGGKDSQAMLDRLVELARPADVMDRLLVVHADLGRVEWPGTRELAGRQAEHYGLPFKVVRNPGWEDLLHRIEGRGKFPDAGNRYCTSEMKTGQVVKLMTATVDDRRVGRKRRDKPPCIRNVDGTYVMRKVRFLNCLGMRAQESPARAKKPPFGFDPAHWSDPPRKSNGFVGRPHPYRHVDRWLPIHAWTEDDVWARIRQSGVEHHPAYDQGMPRLSCSFCVLASKSALVRAAQLRPELAAEYAAVEVRIGHRFKNNLSMAEIIAEAERTTEPVTIDNWTA